jgi:endogenous inhibitor of DNA gyrase (YacG/DUF329 family)
MPDTQACVHCRQRPVEPAFRPFCSERCRMADLGRWLGGGYRIGGEPAVPEAEEPEVVRAPNDDR